MLRSDGRKRRSFSERWGDFIVGGTSVLILLRGGLWLTTSEDVAWVLVVWFAPAWLLAELMVLFGVVTGSMRFLSRTSSSLLGNPIARPLAAAIWLTGLAVGLIEGALWAYALGLLA